MVWVESITVCVLGDIWNRFSYRVCCQSVQQLKNFDACEVTKQHLIDTYLLLIHCARWIEKIYFKMTLSVSVELHPGSRTVVIRNLSLFAEKCPRRPRWIAGSVIWIRWCPLGTGTAGTVPTVSSTMVSRRYVGPSMTAVDYCKSMPRNWVSNIYFVIVTKLNLFFSFCDFVLFSEWGLQ